MFKTTEKAIQWLESVERFTEKFDLSNIKLACELLDNPQDDLRIIHIGGTNGKGSTVTFLKQILLADGQDVGTFISPYVTRFHERIQINGQDISDADLLFYINKVYKLYHKILKKYNKGISYFELLTVMSFLYFKEKEPDFVVYEVGLGGTLDATNIVNPVITGITSIGYDHMKVLGDSLEEIAQNKLGIAKPHIPLVTTVFNESLKPLFEKTTHKAQADLIWLDKKEILESTSDSKEFFYKDEMYTISLLGRHQHHNAACAIEIIQTLNRLEITNINTETIKQGLKETKWAGRLEPITPQIILDGAHNIDAMKQLKNTINKLYTNKNIHVIFTAMKDKDYPEMISIIESFADIITFTEFPYPRCAKAKDLYDTSVVEDKHMNENSYDIIDNLHLGKDTIYLFTGSLYFISYVRNYVLQKGLQQ
ncbi:MAG: bifunctional folylpolyglutamate synthase/dihydrofolate synthase [Candidatus Izimaplasma sp.]|nr:bifunctional folylpolyglutamate synthase/dihydrofolate synthase [Candidatus Izimaplasma bacterium]